jgi:hypothetical protein
LQQLTMAEASEDQMQQATKAFAHLRLTSGFRHE